MKYFCLFPLISILGCISRNELSDDEIKNTALLYTRQFYSCKLDSLHQKFNDKSFTLQNLKDFRIKVDSVVGKEIEVIDQSYENKIWKNKTYYGYVRHSKFSKTDIPVRTIFSFDNKKMIYRFELVTIPQSSPSRFENYITKTSIRLPFEGEWYVAAGGRSSMHNHHTVAADQRFAIDFLIEKDGLWYKNKGSRNSDYYCFNKKVFAPGAGVIADVVNNIPENQIGVIPPSNSGNRVIIDHLNGEYSVLCHFKKSSISVHNGDTVTQGQYLGRCGNSGHSYGPHIHYHMQNSPVMFEGEGLPIQFISFYEDSVYKESGETEWGYQVRNKK